VFFVLVMVAVDACQPYPSRLRFSVMTAFSKKSSFFNFPSLQEEFKRVYYVMKADEVP